MPAPRLLAAAASVALALGAVTVVAGPAHAATYPVATEAELVAAINSANGDGVDDVIQITAPIALTAALPAITTTVTVDGGGFTLTGNGFAAFTVTSATVGIETITIDGASTAISASDADLALTDVDVLNSTGVGVHIDDSHLDYATGTLTDNAGHNLLVENFDPTSRTVLIDTVESTGSVGGAGLHVSQTSPGSVSLINIDVRDNDAEGAYLSVFGAGGATATATTLYAQNNGEYGFEFIGSDTSVITATSVTVDNFGVSAPGIRALAGGTSTTTLTGATVLSASIGFVLTNQSPGATLTASDLTAQFNETGILGSPYNGATVTIDNADASQNDTGIRMAVSDLDPDPDNGGLVIIQNSVVHNNDIGVLATPFVIETDVLIRDTTIRDNDSIDDGAGISAYLDNGSTFTIERSTVSGNTTTAGVGGIFIESEGADSTVNIVNSTVTGNSGPGVAGIVTTGPGLVSVRNSTIADNESSALPTTVQLDGDDVSVRNTIVTGGAQALSATAPTLALDWNLVTSSDAATAVALASGTGNQVGVDPSLGVLADNGGPTFTMLPEPGSLAINLGDPAFAPPPSVEQRGSARVVDGRIDIGAVEVAATLPATGATISGWVIAAGVVLLLAGVAVVAVRQVARRAARRS